MKRVEIFLTSCGQNCPHYNVVPGFHTDGAECELLDCLDPRAMDKDVDDAFPLLCPLEND